MKKTNLLILSVTLLIGVLVGCSSTSSSEAKSSSSASEATSSNQQTVSSSSSSSSAYSSSYDKYNQDGRYYTNNIDYVVPSWDYDTKYAPYYQVKGDKDPAMTDRIATYTYAVINQYIDPHDGLTNEYKSQEAEKEAVAFFEKLAQIICPNYNDDNARWDSPTCDPEIIEKNVVTIYDYVCSHVYYDIEAVKEGGVTDGYTPKGILNNSDLDHEDVNDYRIFTVCRGYADLMNIMLNGIGIPSIESLGRDYNTNKAEIGQYQDHVWNEVYYNGRWHVIDATWESNSAGEGYWYYKSTKTYTAGIYDPNKRIYFDTIPDYTSWEDVRNYTNYFTQSHVIEARNVNQIQNMKDFSVVGDGYDFTFSTTLKEVTDGNINIYSYVGEDSEVTIPSDIDLTFAFTEVIENSDGSYTKATEPTERTVSFMTSGIESNAFKNATEVTKVTVNIDENQEADKIVEDGVTVTRTNKEYMVKRLAFTGATKLNEVVFSDGNIRIDSNAFSKTNVKKLTFLGRPDLNSNSGLLNCSSLQVYYYASDAWTAVIDVNGDNKTYRNHTANEMTVSGN